MDYIDLERRLRSRLTPLAAFDAMTRDFDDGAALVRQNQAPSAVTASAILIPFVRRPAGWTLLLTQRAHAMPHHPGAFVFPGGRMHPEDDGPVATALRETEEETGIPRALFSPVGGCDLYVTRDYYRIAPVVALIDPGFTPAPNPREVAAVFEAPLSFLFDPANHLKTERSADGEKIAVDAITYEGRDIWGITAILIRTLFERLYAP